MTETPEELRQRVQQLDNAFFEEVERRIKPLRDRSLEYEKLAISYSEKGFQTLTYLNGGALVAIPAALSFFKAEVPGASVMWTAAAFILGLLFVVAAQGAAFFTMARRAEANSFLMNAQFNRMASLRYPPEHDDHKARWASSTSDDNRANKKLGHSDVWRIVGLTFFVCALLAFIGGCLLGAHAVLAVKG
ncbi:hypothetical protein IVB40_32545 [Bradyrhizobium sp. 40]|uniref:hypothetical protein n=1 Tax=Bradyrhizobium sp. 40 TaxID=2782674 RepID=UPI001FFF3625|nr:hypothetical protein [Bradyrhizobium sp. 40]UPJ41955.1 hypothetical protein IVB40_32545 [Bradyrhizobium sp. 40]